MTQQARTAVTACADASLWPLSDSGTEAFLDDMWRVLHAAWAAVLHGVREADRRGLAAAQQAPSTKAWLRDRLQISPAAAAQLLVHAAALDADPRLDAALTSGELNTDQLAAITDSLRALPADLSAGLREQAATMLLGFATELDPIGLRKAGRRVLAHLAPHVEDAADRAALDRADRAARQDRYLKLRSDGDGRTRISGLFPAEDAATITAALDPLCTPDAATAEAATTGTPRTPAQRRADAFVDVCRIAMTGGTLPDNGGDRPHVAVTIDYHALIHKLGAGLLDTGDPISAETARRLACDARLLPFVLGGPGQILDAGRSRRLVTTPLRRALTVRDRGCAFPGCDRPARWCEAHHIQHWLAGGPTDLDNLVLLCAFHHHAIHDATSGWQIQLGADRQPDFLPPAWLDPTRTPRRNTYHPRI